MTKPKSKSPPEPTRKEQMDAITGSIGKVIVALKDLSEGATSTDPYLADAQSFLTQAGVCVEKQIITEFGVELPEGKPSQAT